MCLEFPVIQYLQKQKKESFIIIVCFSNRREYAAGNTLSFCPQCQCRFLFGLFQPPPNLKKKKRIISESSFMVNWLRNEIWLLDLFVCYSNISYSHSRHETEWAPNPQRFSSSRVSSATGVCSWATLRPAQRFTFGHKTLALNLSQGDQKPSPPCFKIGLEAENARSRLWQSR